jgi:hypothetical protein
MLPYSHRLEVHHRPKLRIGAVVDATMNNGKSRGLKRECVIKKYPINLVAVLDPAILPLGRTLGMWRRGSRGQLNHHRYSKAAETVKFGKSSPNGGKILAK